MTNHYRFALLRDFHFTHLSPGRTLLMLSFPIRFSFSWCIQSGFVCCLIVPGSIRFLMRDTLNVFVRNHVLAPILRHFHSMEGNCKQKISSPCTGSFMLLTYFRAEDITLPLTPDWHKKGPESMLVCNKVFSHFL